MTRVIAHRGASAYKPENTIPAFEKAIELGADMAELDVQRTSDGVVVVFHDDTTERWNGQARLVSDCTFAEMQALDIGGAQVPTLAEVCALARIHDLSLNIEIKAGGIAEDVAKVVRQERADDLILFSSFWAGALREAAEAAPSLPRAYLMGTRSYRPDVRLREAWPFNALREYDCAAWHPSVELPLLSVLIPLVRRAGYQVNVWTVNNPDSMRHLIGLETDGIITDTPDVLRSVLRESH